MESSPKGHEPAATPERVLRTFFFSDIVSSTAIRDAWVRRFGTVEGNAKYRREVLEPHDRRLREHFDEFSGTVVSGEGDSFFAVFRDARQAVQCAVAIQGSLSGDPIPITGLSGDLPRRVQVRIGVHTGTAVQIERGSRPNYDDHTINIAHRIQERAAPDQILSSRDTWKDTGEIEGITGVEHPGHTLKGVQEAWTLVEILWGDREPHAPSPEAEPAPPVGAARGDLGTLREDYLKRLVSDHEWLDFSGVPQVRNVVRLKLEDVFVPLSATRELPEGSVPAAPRRASGTRPSLPSTRGRRVPLRSGTH